MAMYNQGVLTSFDRQEARSLFYLDPHILAKMIQRKYVYLFVVQQIKINEHKEQA